MLYTFCRESGTANTKNLGSCVFAADHENKSRCTAAAFGGAPHQSEKCFGHFSDSFSPKGEALAVTSALQQQKDCAGCGTKASPLREKLSENRLFGTDFLTDVGDTAPTGR